MWIRTQEYKRTKLPAGHETHVWGRRPRPPLLTLIFTGIRCHPQSQTQKQKQQQRRRTGVSEPHRMNRSNTSLDNSLPRPVSRTTSPSHSSSPKSTHSEIGSVNARSAGSPKSAAISFRSTPLVKRRPKKKASSIAEFFETAVFWWDAPATNSSSESGDEKRTLSPAFRELHSMEWASTPKPI